MPTYEGHRQRLRDKFHESDGAGMADYELLELALTFAIPRRDVKPIAKALLHKFGSLNNVLSATCSQLALVDGVGEAATTLLHLIAKLSLRVKRETLQGAPLMNNRLALLDYLYTLFTDKEREELHVIFLDAKMLLIRDEVLFTGSMSEATIGPREIVKRALELNAAGIVVSHNHPSGNPAPSAQDLRITHQLYQACQAVGIALHDHVIIGHDRHYSFLGAGTLAGKGT